MNLYSRSLAGVYGALLALSCAASLAQTTAQSPSRETLKQTLLRQPLHFEANADGGMSSRGTGRKLRIDDGGAVMFGEPGKTSVAVLLDGADSLARPVGQGLLTGLSNYMLGNDPAKWRTGVSQFSRVQVSSVYPGVDVVYYGNGDQLEHDYLLAANADPGRIRMKFRGASARLDAKTGDLVLQQPESSEEAVRLERPVAYQLSESGERRSVAASYRLQADGEAQFTLGNYDHARPLVIDPVILYGTYFGGKYNDSIVDLKVAGDGSLYLLLTTDTTDLKTPGATAGACIGKCGAANADNGSNSTPDIYLAKLDGSAQTLLFATYLGGSASDQGYNLALDTDGSVYVAGVTQSTDFPIVNGYPGGTPGSGGSQVGTLTKLSADGSTILYSTFIGYGKPSVSYAPPMMVTANNGIVYLIGIANAASGFIWKTNPLFTSGNDFLAKLDTTKSGSASIVYATQVGSSNAQLASVAVDSKGDVWLYGETTDAAFPATTAGALEPQCRSTPCKASFLMEINPAGTSSPYATYLGGTSSTNTFGTVARDILIDPSDNIYISGYTDSGDFPTLKGAYLNFQGNSAGYATKLSPDGKTLLYSTYIPVGVTIGISAGGQMAFTGVAGAGEPLKNNLQTTQPTGSNVDLIFGLIDTTQSFDNSLLISSYLGTTTGFTQPQRISIASTGQILIVGETSATDLPVVNAYQSTPGGGTYDGFLTAIQTSGTLTLTPNTLAFPSTAVGSTSTAMTATLYNGTNNTITLSAGVLTDTNDFAESDNCKGSLTLGASCTLSFSFTPKSASSLNTVFTIGDANSSSLLSVSLTGTGTAATKTNTVTPSSVDFGSVALLTRATQVVTFTNNGSSSLRLAPATISDPNGVFASDFNGSCTNNPVVPAGGTCTYELIFIPQAYKTYSGAFTVVDGITNPVVTLTGTGDITTPQVTLTPNPLTFGPLLQGQVAQMAFTLTNNSTFPITFSDTVETITGPGAVDFSAQGVNFKECPIDYNHNNNVTVAAGTSCQYEVSWGANIGADQSESATLTIPFSVPGSSFPYAVIATMTGSVISPATAVVSPTTLQFPATPAGKTSAALTVTLKNSGEQLLGFTSALISGTNAANFTATNNCPASLGKNATCQISVTFSPDATANEFTAVLDVKTSTGDTNVTLNGGTNPSDFVLSSPTTTQGSPNPTWEIDVAPLTASIGFNEPITFTVTGLDASYGTPIFTPSTLTPKGASVSTILTLGPVTSKAFNQRPGVGQRPTWPLLACLTLFLGLGTKVKSVRGRRVLMLIACATMGGLTLAACGNPPNPVTFTVTATSGSITHAINLTYQPPN